MKIRTKIFATLLASAITVTSVGFLSSFSNGAGKDGIVPIIGENGNWWIGDTDTGVSAIGAKGEKGDTGAKGETGDTGAKGDKGDTGDKGESGSDASGVGADGIVPHIGENGNWWVGDIDTGIPAKGETGDKGDTGAKGDKGETGDKGEKGDDGDPGKDGSAGRDGADGFDAIAHVYRLNQLTQKIEVSYDGGDTWEVLASIPSDAVSIEYPVDSILPLEGTIAYNVSDGKYIVVDDPYYGAVIDVSGIAYNNVTLRRNRSGNALVYAFLKEELKVNQVPVYATGYETGVIVTKVSKVNLEIPEDAVYLYVGYQDLDEMCVPSSIKFFKTGEAAEPYNPLKDSALSDYTFPTENLQKLDGAITLNYGAKDYNTFVKSASSYGAVVSLDGCVFNTVTISKNANGNPVKYAFLSASPTVGVSPTYATGYVKVVSESASEITLSIPDNAKYLYVVSSEDGADFTPSAIKFTTSAQTEEDDGSVRLATWNIGHYSMGVNKNSSIANDQYGTKAKDFLNYINYCLDADIISLNEYSKLFTPAYSAKNAIFKEYGESYEFDQMNYSCNAVFSKLGMTNVEMHTYDCNVDADITHTDAIEASDYYFITADITVNGETVKLVMTHLAFDDNYDSYSEEDEIVKNQMRELIAYCESFERVVMMGDWNAYKFSYFDLFCEAGYSLALTEANLPTYAGNNYCIDNIIYKGVSVSNVTLAGTDLSDHYAVYCDVSVIKGEN